jgi:ribose transport system permease protein
MTIAEATERWTPTNGRTTARRLATQFALALLIVAVIVVAGLTTPGFAETTNYRAILINTAIIGIAAVGMTAVTLSGNFFSMGIGPTVVMAGIVFLALAGRTGSIAVAMVATVAVICVLGVVQALIVAAGLNPIITTLAFGTIVYGLLAVGTGGEVVTAGSVPVTTLATSDVLGLPMPVVAFVVLTIIASILTERTVLGRRLRLVGQSRETGRISGISVLATTIAAFLSMSVGAALAGIFSAAQLRQMQANDLPNLTMDVIAAVLVGGAAVSGGDASPVRSALGALLLAILSNVMLLQGFAPGVRVFGVGLITVVLVVSLHMIRKAGR